MNSPKQWTRIDRAEPGLHDLLYEDPCFYYLQRTNEGYGIPANQRLINFKHDPKRFRTNERVWGYKLAEIEAFGQDVAGWLANAFDPPEWRGNAVLVPMPTSRPSTDEFFDSRLVDLCRVAASLGGMVRVENILDVKPGIMAAHAGGSRDIDYLMENTIVYEPTQSLSVVILIDDILTSGRHYAASRMCLKQCFPNVQTIGLFLARHRESDQWE